MRPKCQSKGSAVALQRTWKVSSRSARSSRSAKSCGLITLRWTMEKWIPIWFSQLAWTGRCTSWAVGQVARIRMTACGA